MWTVPLSWLIMSLCFWVLLMLPVVALCVSTKAIDQRLACERER